MTWTPERSSVNQQVQIGAESTTALGVAVPAGKRIQCFDWVFGINGDIQRLVATGHKYTSVQEENTEWVDGTLTGTMDYNGVIYPLASVMGSATPVAHGSSATANDWIFTPPITGSIVPQTYTVQQGDSTHAHSMSYVIFTQFGYKGDRKSLNVSGTMISQPISDGITLTSSPTAIALNPIVAKQVNVYLDSTSNNLGQTKLLKVMQYDYTMSGVYGPFWPINRSNVGFTSHVDLPPTCTIKLMVEADTSGMALLNYLQTGTTYYLRVQGQGSQIAGDGPGAVYATFTHDMAIKIGKPSTYQDKDGIFAIEWECIIVEDPTWGKSQTVTVTNLITAL